MSAQLSLPPDNPTITRSPSSMRPNSVMARVTLFARRVSSGDLYDIGVRLRFKSSSRAGPRPPLSKSSLSFSQISGRVRNSVHLQKPPAILLRRNHAGIAPAEPAVPMARDVVVHPVA